MVAVTSDKLCHKAHRGHTEHWQAAGTEATPPDIPRGGREGRISACGIQQTQKDPWAGGEHRKNSPNDSPHLLHPLLRSHRSSQQKLCPSPGDQCSAEHSLEEQRPTQCLTGDLPTLPRAPPALTAHPLLGAHPTSQTQTAAQL